MKSLARSRFWWPGIDSDIEQLCKSCADCLRVKKSTVVAEHSWPKSSQPFDRLHVDYAGPVEGFYFLVVVDAATNYPFVFKTTTQDTSQTLIKLREVFALFGLPRCLVSDNGPAFRSDAFKQYMSQRGVELWHTPVCHPKSNGLAERFVGHLKLHLKITEGKGDLDSRLQVFFLLQYRCASVHSGDSPAERLLSFKPRLPALLASPGQPILYQRFQAHSSTFEPGVVLSTSGKSCINIYDESRDTVHVRHQEQDKHLPQGVAPAVVLPDAITADVEAVPEVPSDIPDGIPTPIPDGIPTPIPDGIPSPAIPTPATTAGRPPTQEVFTRPRRNCGPPSRYKDFVNTTEEM
jgi:hypothetical protein